MSLDQDYSAGPDTTSLLRQKLNWICTLLALSQFAFIAVFTFNQPWADEWEFIPALCGQESTATFLWAQHNEHRLPLPRAIFLGLFHLTHDFRAGAVVQVILYTLLAFAGMRWAAELRGRPSWADLFFPLSLLHVGHSENLLMGYQLCFALACTLVIGLARLALWAKPENRLRTAFTASLLSAALALCGGFGAVFSLPAMIWIWYLLFFSNGSESGGTSSPCGNGAGGRCPPPFRSVRRFFAFAIALFSLFPVVYLRFYFQDYHRPEGHPPFEWKNWYAAAQVTMEVLAVGFGIAVEWIWLAVFLGILLASFLVAVEGLNRFRINKSERPRVSGLVAVCLGVCGLALAIGAGRSGFGDDFGLWPRYSMLTWPLLATLYFAAVAWGGNWLKTVPEAFMLLSLVLFPFNTKHGLERGINQLKWLGKIETMLAEGVPDEIIVKEQIEATGQGDRAIRGIPLLRERGIGPFGK
jgi:hypothetical protein